MTRSMVAMGHRTTSSAAMANDVLIGGNGNDELDGGAGIDLAIYTDANGGNIRRHGRRQRAGDPVSAPTVWCQSKGSAGAVLPMSTWRQGSTEVARHREFDHVQRIRGHGWER